MGAGVSNCSSQTSSPKKKRGLLSFRYKWVRDAFIAYLQSEKSPTFPIAERSQLKTSPYTKSWFTGAQKRLSQNLTWVKQDSSWTVKSPPWRGWIPNTTSTTRKKGFCWNLLFPTQISKHNTSLCFPSPQKKKSVLCLCCFVLNSPPGLAGHLKHSLRFMKFRSPPWCQRNCCWDVTYPSRNSGKRPLS